MYQDAELEPLFCLELIPEEECVTFPDEHDFLQSSLLYPAEKNLELLNSFAPLSPFNWCNFKQCYRNICLDYATNQVVLYPITPHQLLEDATFQKFLTDNEKNLILVARLGYEIHFGLVENLKVVEQKILDWFNHHIYDTTVIADVHDFYPNTKDRRIQTYNAMIVPKANNKGKARVYWKKGHLNHLQTQHL